MQAYVPRVLFPNTLTDASWKNLHTPSNETICTRSSPHFTSQLRLLRLFWSAYCLPLRSIISRLFLVESLL